MQDENLRVAVKAMDEQVATLTHAAPAGPALGGLAEAWAGMVKALDLQPAPLLRDCPACGKSGMLAATRCGYCWAVLTPPASLPV